MKRLIILTTCAAAGSSAWLTASPEPADPARTAVVIAQPVLKDIAAVQAAWQELQKTELRDAVWRLKTEAVWDRWAVLDTAGALSALEENPASGRGTEWDTDHWEGAGYLPHRRVFFALAARGKAHALKHAEGRPWRVPALKGAGERLAMEHPEAYFALKDAERDMQSPRYSAIAFRRWLAKDFRAAKAWLMAATPELSPQFPSDQIKPGQLCCEHWLQMNAVELAEAVLARQLPRDTDVSGLYPQLIAALEKKQPDLLTRLANFDPLLLKGLVASDFAAALALAERMPVGARRLLCPALSGDNAVFDPAAAAAWLAREIGTQPDPEAGLSHAANGVFPEFWEQNAEAAAAWLGALPEKVALRVATGDFAQRLAANATPAEQGSVLDKLPPAAARALTARFLSAAASQIRSGRLETLLPRLPPGRDRDSALESLARAAPDDATALAYIAQIQDEQTRHDHEAMRVAASLRKRNEPPEQLLAGIQTPAVKEKLAIGFAGQVEQDPIAAWQWSLLIAGPHQRKQAQDSIMQRWPLALRREAVRLINETAHDVPEVVRERWLKRFQ